MSKIGVKTLIAITLALGLAGGVVKITGSLLYGSQALLVDSLTCFANAAALVASVHFLMKTFHPPDVDHPFGHYRLGYGGILVTLISYSFVAGVALTRIVSMYKVEYTVDFRSTYFASMGLLIYGVTIYVSLKIGGFLKTYGLFTVSELFESTVTIAASIAGSLFNYIYDYISAVVLTIYIFYELFSNGKELLESIVDVSAPENILKDVIEDLVNQGFEVLDIRLRKVSHNRFHGDVKVKPRNVRFDEIDSKIDIVKKHLESIHNVDLAIEVSYVDEVK